MGEEKVTNSKTIEVGNHVHFSSFAVLLEKIAKIDEATNIKGKIEEKKRLVQQFLELWRDKAKQLKNSCKEGETVNESFLPIMRFLLPDIAGRVYGLKENKLANYLIEVLSISKNSTDGKKLLNYRAPQNAKSDGDFASVAFFVLKTRCVEKTDEKDKPKIEDVNKHLNLIAINNTKGKEGHNEVSKSIRYLIMHLSALQLKWLIRIILKNLNIGIKENAIFDVYHPDAMDLWNATSNFENVCNILSDPTKRMHEIAITLFSPCRPMLGDKAKPNNIENLMGGSEFYIETKYDGERFQLHKNSNKYSYFSRNSNDYTESFGSSNINGIFTQYIHDCFHDNVNSVILDGEMCVYSNDDKILLTKSDSYDVKSMDRRAFETDVQVCFCVFDILLYNDEVLTNKPLKERLEYLNKTFEECEGRLIISPRQTCKNNQEAIDALNKAIDCRLEGIVVKNPLSVYKPNVRSGSGWYKVKPDYMIGMNDDLDLLIVGGYYGTGRRTGLLSHFLLAVAYIDKKSSAETKIDDEQIVEPKLFYSFCKVGSGYTMKELSDFNRKLTNKWNIYDKKDPPKHLAVTYEKPDVWIKPEDSLIVQVKAVEIAASDKYKAGCSLRFPRLEKFRDDKQWFECMTFDELTELRSKNEGKLASKHFMAEDGDEPEMKRKRGPINRVRLPLISSQFRGIDASSVEKIGEFFKEKEFCIVIGDEKYDKQTLEKHVIENGGIIVQNPGEKTYCVLTSKLIHKVNIYITKDSFDIVKTEWLIKCIQNKMYYPWTPSDMFHATKKTREYFSDLFDKYGDHFDEDVDLEKIKAIFTNMNKDFETNNDQDMHLRIAFMENKYFPDESSEYGLFRLCNVYLDLYKTVGDEKAQIDNSSLDLIKMKLSWYGSAFSTKINDSTTHCVLDKSDLSRLDVIKLVNRSRFKKLHIVTKDWVLGCINKKRLIEELSYHL